MSSFFSVHDAGRSLLVSLPLPLGVPPPLAVVLLFWVCLNIAMCLLGEVLGSCQVVLVHIDIVVAQCALTISLMLTHMLPHFLTGCVHTLTTRPHPVVLRGYYQLGAGGWPRVLLSVRACARACSWGVNAGLLRTKNVL